MHPNLGLWILRPDLGQAKPSQASGHGKNVRVSTSSPVCEREQYSQSIMGMGPRWTTSHWHQQHHSCSSMIDLTMRTKNDCIMYNIVLYVHHKGKTNPYYFSPQVKNKPSEPLGTMHLSWERCCCAHFLSMYSVWIMRLSLLFSELIFWLMLLLKHIFL